MKPKNTPGKGLLSKALVKILRQEFWKWSFVKSFKAHEKIKELLLENSFCFCLSYKRKAYKKTKKL